MFQKTGAFNLTLNYMFFLKTISIPLIVFEISLNCGPILIKIVIGSCKFYFVQDAPYICPRLLIHLSTWIF